MRQSHPNATDFVVLLVGAVLFMAAFIWAAADAEADLARAECVTDAQCEAAYGFDMYGNR